MTTDQAINMLSSEIKLDMVIDAVICGMPGLSCEERDELTAEMKQAMKMGADALRRLEPTVPDFMGDEHYIDAYCPNCSALLDDDEDPCEKCGQRIFWEY